MPQCASLAGKMTAMWVRLREWMIADQEPPLPSVGAVLTGLGLRVRGEVTPTGRLA